MSVTDSQASSHPSCPGQRICHSLEPPPCQVVAIPQHPWSTPPMWKVCSPSHLQTGIIMTCFDVPVDLTCQANRAVDGNNITDAPSASIRPKQSWQELRWAIISNFRWCQLAQAVHREAYWVLLTWSVLPLQLLICPSDCVIREEGCRYMRCWRG